MSTSKSTQPEPWLPVIENWLQDRFGTMFSPWQFVRYEATLYRPLNAYLSTVFPITKRHLVKPQGHLLPGKEGEWKGDDDDEQEATLYLEEVTKEPEETPQPGPSGKLVSHMKITYIINT